MTMGRPKAGVIKHYKTGMFNTDRLRMRGVVHPSVWAAAKRGERDALRWIIEDMEDLSLVGGFIGGVYRRAARRIRNIERCVR